MRLETTFFYERSMMKVNEKNCIEQLKETLNVLRNICAFLQKDKAKNRREIGNLDGAIRNINEAIRSRQKNRK